MRPAAEQKSRPDRNERILMWLLLAGACLALRGIFYGWLLSPTFRVILGIDGTDLFGPVAGNRIALEDPLLLLAAAAAAVMAWRQSRLTCR